MTNITPISNKFQTATRKFVADLGKSDKYLPIILLEAAVVAGRTYHAYDRGGFIEARERGTEEILGSIFWLGGVQAFNKMGDQIGKKVLKLDTVDFEVGKDAVRNPVKNFIQKYPKFNEKTLGIFKFAKITSSILLANAIIGFVVPKINQAITKKYQKSIEEIDKQKNGNQDKTGTTFEGGNPQMLLTLANSFENDARYKLLSTDVGIAGGRAVNARNKYERREILFRDLSSIYFYVFCRNDLNKLLNKIQLGRTSRLDPVSTQMLDEHLQNNIDKNKSYSAEEFERLVFGDKKTQVPDAVQKNIKNGIIPLDEFKKSSGASEEVLTRAAEMSKLQPPLNGVSILTGDQVKNVYRNGLIDDPKMLKKVFEKFSDKKSTNPMQYFPEKDLKKLKTDMVDYVKDIIKKSNATGDSITIKTLKKANKMNFLKNTTNLGAGFALSAYFLSTAIPQIQYWLTKKQTGQDKFPGVEKYNK